MIRLHRRAPQPNAHAVRPPGPRLLRFLPLRFFQRDASKGRNMPRLASLSMLALVAILAPINFALLPLFQASGECCVNVTTCVPSAANGEEIEDAPMVLVNETQILVDGVLVGQTAWVTQGDPAPLDELRQNLRNKLELYKQVRPNAPMPDRVLFQIHRDVPAGVVKAVVAAAATVGLKPSFMVQKIDAPLQ